MEGDAGVNCLFCCSSIDTTKPGGVESIGISTYEALEVTFAELCSLLHISFPSKWKSWDFENEPFPFCNQCHGEIATVCDLSDQVKRIQWSISSILAQLTATALGSAHPGSSSNEAIGDRLTHPQQRTVPANKHEFFRESIIKSYTPILILQPLNATAASRSLIKPLTANIHDETTGAEHEDSDSSYCFGTDPFDDCPDLFEPLVIIKVDPLPSVDDTSNCLEEEPSEEREIPATKKERKKPAKVEIELVDEATSTFSFSGFKFQEINNNLKCLTCPQICSFRKDRKKGTNAYYEYMRLHITKAHIEPKILATAAIKKNAKTDTTSDLTPAKRSGPIHHQSTSDALPIQQRLSSAHLSVKAEEKEMLTKVNDKYQDFGNIQDPGDPLDLDSDFSPAEDASEISEDDADSDYSNERPKTRSKSLPRKRSSLQVTTDAPAKKSRYSASQVDLLDETSKMYSFRGFKIQEIDTGFKCLTCFRILKIKNRRNNNRFDYIKLHVKRLHQSDSATTDAKSIQSTRAGKESQNPKVPSTKRVKRQRGAGSNYKLLDEDTKTYSLEGYKFQELENSFKCLACRKVIKARSGNGRIRFQSIQKHVKLLHIDPKRGPVATVVDEETKTYSTLGFQFQQVESGDFKCLVCGLVIKTYKQAGKEHWRSPFTHIKKHMARTHMNVTPENLHDIESSTVAYDFWKEFEASTSSAPKTDARDNPLGAEAGLTENNSLLLEPQPAVEQELLTSAGNFVIRPDCGLEVLDESQKIFSLYGCKFRELAQSYECGTCFKILRFGVGQTKARTKTGSYKMRPVPRMAYIKKHIMEQHVDPSRRAKGPLTLVDASANIYDYQGFQFQGAKGEFRCLKCKELGSSSAEKVYGRSESVKKHIRRDHTGAAANKMPARVWLVHQQLKMYTYNGCEFLDLGEGGHECVICKAVRHTWATMVDHIDQEHKEPVERQCPICPFKYTMVKKLRSHISVSHVEDPTTVCETCGRSYRNRYYLRKHVRQVHGKRPHACGQCDKKFADPSQLRNHILSVHEGVRSFVCEVCGKGFYNASLLKFHQEIHATNKPYVCDQCGKAFSQKTCLNRHLLMVHQGFKLPQKYPCGICGKKYQSRFSAKVHHRAVHLGIRPIRVRDHRRERKRRKTVKPPPSLDEPRDDAAN